MKKLTREEAIELHKKMWNWIADETERTGLLISKSDYFMLAGAQCRSIPAHTCYCCEYDRHRNSLNHNGRCKYCPLDWGSKCNLLMCIYKEKKGDNNGLYARWLRTQDIKERVKLARQIANLEVR